MRIGYARVSTADQTAVAQLDRLSDAGCERVFTDQAVSGAMASRPQLDVMIGQLRAGDEIVVYSLSRLGRSTRNLLELVERFEAAGVKLVSLTEAIDTSTPAGRMVITVLAAVAELEREMTRDRTIAGLTAARARGRVGGRPPALTTSQVDAARKLHRTGSSIREIAVALNAKRSTVHNAVREVVAAPRRHTPVHRLPI